MASSKGSQDRATHLAYYLKRVMEQALVFINEYIKETEDSVNERS